MLSPHSEEQWNASAVTAVLFFHVTILPRLLSLSNLAVQSTGSGDSQMKLSENVLNTLLRIRIYQLPKTDMKLLSI